MTWLRLSCVRTYCWMLFPTQAAPSPGVLATAALAAIPKTAKTQMRDVAKVSFPIPRPDRQVVARYGAIPTALATNSIGMKSER